ncbi:MAG: hypothetical protein WD602_00295 [Actinomycetota bacterium]
MMADLFNEHFPTERDEQSSGSRLVEQAMRSASDGLEEAEASDGAGEQTGEETQVSSDETPASSSGVSTPPRSQTTQPAQPAAPAPRTASGPSRTVHSTAYCLTGQMASGRRTYTGAAAMNGVPLGARYRVLSGPAAGRVFTIEDRIGWGSQFDIAYPGNCGAARQYGSRTISIERM